MENFNEHIKNKANELRADLIGFADISSLDNNSNMGFKYGISIGIKLDKNIIEKIPFGPFIDYYEEYEAANKKLDYLRRTLSEYIIGLGYSSFGDIIPQNDDLRTPLPHKTIARLAGIGWIGKSSLLINEKYGSAIRITSILTNIPLEVNLMTIDSKCKDCKICYNACPANAINGVDWSIETDRDKLIDPRKCKSKVIERGKKFNIDVASCGICIAVCPYTKKYLNSKVLVPHFRI